MGYPKNVLREGSALVVLSVILKKHFLNQSVCCFVFIVALCSVSKCFVHYWESITRIHSQNCCLWQYYRKSTGSAWIHNRYCCYCRRDGGPCHSVWGFTLPSSLITVGPGGLLPRSQHWCQVHWREGPLEVTLSLCCVHLPGLWRHPATTPPCRLFSSLFYLLLYFHSYNIP